MAQEPGHPEPVWLQWPEAGAEGRAHWQSAGGMAAPQRVQVVDDGCTANHAYRLVCEGTGLLWRGDFQNARQLLQALARRLDRPGPRAPVPAPADTGTDLARRFYRYRQAQAQRARVLGLLLIPLDADRGIPLRRAPDLRQACLEAWGPVPVPAAPAVAPLRELLGLVGAHEWRKKGVPVPALGPLPNDRIHPHYGVFSPVRGEYVDLVARAPLPTAALQARPCAFDIGTGTGVLAAVLARRGVAQVLATDLSPRALACAQDNLQRLGLSERVQLQASDLFPEGQAALVVCNPPWLPGRPHSLLDQAVYDLDSRMLRGFLQGLAAHLVPQGEGWLILSDLAERLGLRPRDTLLEWVAAAGLRVLGRLDTRPQHRRAQDAGDPLHAARAAEITSLWRLGPA